MRCVPILVLALTIIVVPDAQSMRPTDNDTPFLQKFKHYESQIGSSGSPTPYHHYDHHDTSKSSRDPNHARPVVVGSVPSSIGFFSCGIRSVIGRANEISRKTLSVIRSMSLSLAVGFLIFSAPITVINHLSSGSCREYTPVNQFGVYDTIREYQVREEGFFPSYTLYDDNDNALYKFDKERSFAEKWDVLTQDADGSWLSSNAIQFNSETASEGFHSSPSYIAELRRDIMDLLNTDYKIKFTDSYPDINSIDLRIRSLDEKYVLTVNGIEFIAPEEFATRWFHLIPVLTFGERTSPSSDDNSSAPVATHLGVVVGKFYWLRPTYRICLPSTDDPALDQQRLLALSTAAIAISTEERIKAASQSSSTSSSSSDESENAAPARPSIPLFDLAPNGNPLASNDANEPVSDPVVKNRKMGSRLH